MGLEIAISLLTLTALEIVLGIDNLVFISIIAEKLPKNQQNKARKLGLLLALASRMVLLLAISWMMRLTKPLFEIFSQTFSGKDIILLFGGLFLLGKATFEIHELTAGNHPEDKAKKKTKAATFAGVLIQIILLDIVFSLDSVITGVGLVSQVWVIVVAMVIAMIVMIISVDKVNSFIQRNPAFKMLALCFLLMIGVMLIADGFHQHVPRGYIYFSMVFASLVEMLNIRHERKLKKT